MTPQHPQEPWIFQTGDRIFICEGCELPLSVIMTNGGPTLGLYEWCNWNEQRTNRSDGEKRSSPE